jgi:hypothetical protein
VAHLYCVEAEGLTTQPRWPGTCSRGRLMCGWGFPAALQGIMAQAGGGRLVGPTWDGVLHSCGGCGWVGGCGVVCSRGPADMWNVIATWPAECGSCG